MTKYDFSPDTRKAIKARDNNRCIVCGSTFWLGIAHVFVSRAKGGLGVEQNGVLLCQSCHHALDNGRSAEKQRKIKETCEAYLNARYDVNMDKIRYNKFGGYRYE